MSQPPYPPQGGNEPGDEQPGGWKSPAGSNDPTQQIGQAAEGHRDQTQQYGRPLYGPPAQPPYGQPPYGQQAGEPPYGQPPYGQQAAEPPYGQPPYGQPPYGQPPYGQPQYGQQPGQPAYGQQPGQPPYGQPPYGQPPYGQPGQQWAPPGGPGRQKPKGNKNTLIALIVAGVVVVAAIAVALFLLWGKDTASNTAGSTTSAASISTSAASTAERPSTSVSSSASSSASTASASSPSGNIPAATVPPDGLGDDPALNQYAQSCYDGDMAACDSLYKESAIDSLYETYGGTCAGRQPVSSADTVYCTEAFPS